MEDLKKVDIKGLTFKEVDDRIKNNLTNKKKNRTDRTYGKIIVKNVFTFFNILLLILGIILIYFGKLNSCAFLVILIFNLLIGLIQDLRSKRLVDKLNLINKSKIKVIRDGKEILIDNEDIVLNDIIHLTNGEQIPCDSLIVSGTCRVDESLLTGESIPLKKSVNDNLLSGTYITNGDVYVEVKKVGIDNYIEQLQAKTKSFKSPKSQMFHNLNMLFKVITVIVIVFGIIDIIEFILLQNNVTQIKSYEEFYNIVGTEIVSPLSGALISMIPSGMYLLTSTSLTVGIINLAKKKVIVQDMYSIETIARMDTLCIDKTGTITDGTMCVNDYIIYDKNVSNNDFINLIANSNKALNDTNFTALALKDKFKENNNLEVLNKIPFNSINKYSVVSFKDFGSLVVGAYGFVPLKNDSEIKAIIEDYSKKGLRVLVVGKTDEIIDENKKFTCDLIGIIIIQDKIRDNANEIISWLNDNDVDIKVISGDNVYTVSEISRITGIKNSDKYISLEGLSDKEVEEAALKYSIFGRVSPEQKEIIVKSLKSANHVVGMFGDGINDTLGLKQANVSISLKSAAKAAQNVANLILVDNDFSHIPEIISQGRRVINNLQRTCSLFLVKTVFSMFLNAFFAIFALTTKAIGTTATLWPFEPNNFYAWEIVTIGLASFFLALEPNNERVHGSFLSNILKKSIPNGCIIGFVVMIAYLFLYNSTEEYTLKVISTYFISIISLVILFKVCMKFNMYRLCVFAGSVVLIGFIFGLSIFGSGFINLLKFEGETPRFLSSSEINTLIILLGIGVILLVLKDMIAKKIENKEEEEYEKD